MNLQVRRFLGQDAIDNPAYYYEFRDVDSWFPFWIKVKEYHVGQEETWAYSFPLWKETGSMGKKAPTPDEMKKILESYFNKEYSNAN